MDVLTRQKFIQLTLRRVKPGSGSTNEFLTTRTWNKQVTDLRRIIQVNYVIVDGVATRLYMPERMTYDLDILIHEDEAAQAYLADTFNRDISRHHGYLECPVQHHQVNW